MSPNHDHPGPCAGLSAGAMALWWLVLFAGLVGWVIMLRGEEPARAWRALLINFLYFVAVGGGLATWSAIVTLAKGRWPGELESITAAGLALAPATVAVLILLWLGSRSWAPWIGQEMPLGLWFGNNVIFLRDLVVLGGFWWLASVYVARRRRGCGSVTAAYLVFVYCIVFSMIGFDLVMAVNLRWYSSLIGGYFFISSLYIGIAAWTLIVVLGGKARPAQHRDLGNLIVGFSILTTYMMFSQLIVLWYENLPHEILFLVPRMNFQPGATVSRVLLAVVYLGPLVLLLMRRARQSRWILGAGSVWVLAGMWLERWWLIEPSFDRGALPGWADVSVFAALLAATVLCFGWYLGRHRPWQSIEQGEA